MENETKLAQTYVRYYVGDLCYVLRDEWDEVCGLLSFDNETVKYELEDGRKFFSLSTMYGDGTYRDNFGRAYGVDAGLIGAIKVDDIRDPDFEKVMANGYAHIVEFSSELQDFDVSSDDDGTLRFGPILIATGDEDED